jgi:hypothetical protein
LMNNFDFMGRHRSEPGNLSSILATMSIAVVRV